ncbi:MAG: PIG-L family deacetylase [Anaerolineaceae bacterium]|jgi:LmbE family N-acetylglucosaminyl deacetylase
MVKIPMKWVYLSPHLDDAVLSCGGLIWEQVQSGLPVEIYAICAGFPPGSAPVSPLAQTLHDRWQTPAGGQEAVSTRRREDVQACLRLGAAHRHFDIPDCIYRWLPGGEPVVKEDQGMFAAIHPQEGYLVDQVYELLKSNLPARARLVSPMTIGGHMDHRIVRAAAQRLDPRLLYYADFPYVAQHPQELTPAVVSFSKKYSLPISDAGLQAWQDGAAAYQSQISTFWSSRKELDTALEAYCREGAGRFLWQTV